ncbi:hypothetical protein [Streptomyces sp. NPDC090025]|uniref:hypothetical protein n=1 Tax=Streptomyces sp. NPDC090025 TaxID=3365922 RepID=UPI0038327ECF
MTSRQDRLLRRVRAGGALAHLLLVVVLAMGVFVMHAVGHPEGSGDGAHSGAGTEGMSHAAMAGPGTADAAPGARPGADSPATGSEARHAPAPASSHENGTGMDMTTLCVAVLGGWLLAALVRAALRRHRDLLVPPLVRLLGALAPHAPPPRPPDLAALSILRV